MGCRFARSAALRTIRGPSSSALRWALNVQLLLALSPLTLSSPPASQNKSGAPTRHAALGSATWMFDVGCRVLDVRSPLTLSPCHPCFFPLSSFFLLALISPAAPDASSARATVEGSGTDSGSPSPASMLAKGVDWYAYPLM